MSEAASPRPSRSPTTTSTALDRRTRLGLAVIIPLYRIWMGTLRVRFRAPEAARTLIESGAPVVFAFWHEHLATTPAVHGGRGIVAMVSRHRDGELITRLLERSGFSTARGSTTRGGAAALRTMLRALAAGHPVALTPDGPKGPRRVAQSGAIEIARRAGVPIVPVVLEFPRAHRFRSWDRTALPWPFTRGVVHYGEPLTVARTDDVGEATTRMQERLDALTERAEAHSPEDWRTASRRSPHPRRPPLELAALEGRREDGPATSRATS